MRSKLRLDGLKNMRKKSWEFKKSDEGRSEAEKEKKGLKKTRESNRKTEKLRGRKRHWEFIVRRCHFLLVLWKRENLT